MTKLLHRVLLATALTVVSAVAGAVSALAVELPIPVNGGVPKNPLPGDHYQFPPARSLPTDPTGLAAVALPWEYAGPAIAVVLVLLAMVLLHMHHGGHHSGTIRRA